MRSLTCICFPWLRGDRGPSSGFVNGARGAKTPPAEPPFMGGCLLTRYDTARGPHTEILCKRMSWIVAQTMVRQLVTPREGVDLIGAPSHEASETFDRIGGLNVSMHPLASTQKT